MSRQSRCYLPGTSVHVIQRGHNGMAIARQDADYEIFLTLLASESRNRAAVHGFVVMTTHYHLVVTPHRPGSLSTMMKKVDERYVRYYNRAYSRTGTLWNGRFRSFPIETDEYWLMCIRYVEQNPVRAGIVKTPEEYRWSSYSAHGYGTGPTWLAEHHVYQALGRTPEQRQAAYRILCGAALRNEQLAVAREGLFGCRNDAQLTSVSAEIAAATA